MNTASDIIEGLGRKELAARLGVGLTAVSNASVSGRFPAAWFAVVSELCEVRGIECPTSAFNFKIPSQHSEEKRDG